MNHAGQTIPLRDGRRLGYAEYGAPEGTPVIGFFGAAARNLRPPDDVTLAHGVRLITVERPGFGLSDFQPDRRLLDWPEDVRQLADTLGLERFAVIGASQGGPFAAACAYMIPDRLTALSLVSALAPFDVPGVTEGMAAPLRAVPFVAQRLPFLLHWSQSLSVPLARRSPVRLFRQMFAGLPESDRAVLRSNPQIEAMFVAAAGEIYRQGGRGIAHDMIVATGPWGFRTEDIRVRTYLWQGEADPNVPPAMGRYLARAIPDCRATFVPGAGHFLYYERWGEILDQLGQ